MKTMNLLLWALASVPALALSGCGTGEANQAAEIATPVPVEFVRPIRTDISATYEATAAITSDADAPVIARVGGQLVELIVEEGQRVEVGQILARLDGERLRLEMLAAKADLARTQSEFDRHRDLHERGLISTSMFEGLQYDLAANDATFKLKQLTYDYSNLRATIAGVVSAREIKPGQNVKAGDVVYRITETAELMAYLQIPQSQLSKFQSGHAATLRVASMPGVDFPATIIRISPTIDTRNGTFRVTAAINNETGKLAPGMFGNFRIQYEEHANALVIPTIALLDEDSQASVYVVNDGEVLRRVIKTGIESGDRIEILDGLAESDQVVVTGQAGLRDGSKVLASNVQTGSFSG